MTDRIAYLPLTSYPEAAPDSAILAAMDVASGFGLHLHVTTFGVKIPPVASPLGGFIINIDGMARATEEHSQAECARLKALVEGAAKGGAGVPVTHHVLEMVGARAAAATEARYFDLAVAPWSADTVSAQDMAQALVFDSGLPVLLVPAGAKARKADHLAIAWDESRVAARALADALRLLKPGGRISVLSVHDEKDLGNADLAQTLAASLRGRGYQAEACDLELQGKPIAEVLQEAALTQGADFLAMGGFGHSRWRDFVLGGATKGILLNLRLPVLLSH
jgi:nucleotide-binding universal stress UspA family protein